MNKFLKFGSLAAIMLSSAMSFTSCDDNDGPTPMIVSYPLMKCYAVVTDYQNNMSQFVSSPVTITVEINTSTQTAVAQITGLSLDGSTTYPAITISNLPWKMDENEWIEIDTPIAEAKTTFGTPIAISDFELKWHNRFEWVETIEEYDPALEYSFNLDNRYKIGGSRSPFHMAGTCKSTPVNGQPYVNNEATYYTTLDYVNKLATITINGAVFAAGMPAQNITLPNIPFTFDESGDIAMNAASITPTINDTPFPNFAITDLRAEIDLGDGMDINFNCNVMGTTYSVECDLNFTTFTEVLI